MNLEQDSSNRKMPALFVGHGSPMNAIEENEFSKAWKEVGEQLPTPEMILCISAHWETEGTFVTAINEPRTIYDFYGFPDELFKVKYPASGSAKGAALVQKIIDQTNVELDYDWGLDHGCWSVLCRMFPKANIPIVQLSLDRTKPSEYHYELGKQLSALRKKNILIVGSGNVVHNLRTIDWNDHSHAWAIEFDKKIEELILAKDHQALINYQTIHPASKLAIPTNEHYLPFLYVLALQEENEKLEFFADKITLGSLSMRSLIIGS
jgi:4,5-DOPA dioxygenase extradiol